jgi:hypothetical protein
MNDQEIEQYFAGISITGPFLERAKEVIAFQKKHFLMDDVFDIFISNMKSPQGGTPIYQSMWFFTNKLAYEVKNFLVKDTEMVDAVRNSISRWEIRRKNFDFETSTDASEMHLLLMIGTVDFQAPGVNAIITATGRNCEYLAKIFKKHIVTKLN